jgi:hypothetical protein
MMINFTILRAQNRVHCGASTHTVNAVLAAILRSVKCVSHVVLITSKLYVHSHYMHYTHHTGQPH